MSYYKRGDVWEAQVYMGKHPKTGRPARLTYTFDTEAEAKEFDEQKKQERKRLRQEHVRPSVTRLRDYLPDWLRRKENELAARSLADYRYCVEKLILPSLGNESLGDLSPARVQAWTDALAPTRDAHGATSAARAFRVLRSALSDAERLGMIARNPAKAARPAQRAPRKRPGFTLAEAQAVMTAARGERLEPLFAFILHTGLRDAEALGLRWRDVDLDRGILSVRQDMVQVRGQGMVVGAPKNPRSARTFAMLPQALQDLKRQKAQQAKERLGASEAWMDHDLVFTAGKRKVGDTLTTPGGPLTTSNVDRAFRRVRERAGVRELPLYSMRHATASILLSSGKSPGVCAKMMGHSLDMFMETYADLLVEVTREVAEGAGAWLEANTPKPAEKEPAQVMPLRRARKRRAAG